MENYSNTAGLRSIFELGSDYNFSIPDYQRGYKWREKDVAHLIDDIFEIPDDDTYDYCLQPIVVAKDGEEWILVDGQQRLTTLWFIINWAKKNWNSETEFPFRDGCYNISYKVREKSNVYINEFRDKGTAEDKNVCDTHYFAQAISVIESKKERIGKFIVHLKNNVKIIWYEIDKEQGAAHFERLNNAKIGLTNAELVKAFLFTRIGAISMNERSKTAVEWDEMEYKLQNDKFFSFVTKKDSPYRKDYNRIELLLDLYVGTKDSDREKDEHHTFNRIAELKRSPLDIWKDVQKIFNRIETWYEDNFLYNLIGYLIETSSGKLPVIWDKCKERSLDEFKREIKSLVVDNIQNIDIKTLVYKQRSETRRILLLFNILSLMSVDENKEGMSKYVFHDRFHFDLFQSEKWDVEHVHATASEALTKKDEWIEWMKTIDIDNVKATVGNSEEIKKHLQKIEKVRGLRKEEYEKYEIDRNEFKTLYKSIIEAMESTDVESDFAQNSIGNLVFLNESINRAAVYKVAPFSRKRQVIMERVKSGKFVPLATQNVFMKVYTPNPRNFFRWEKDSLNSQEANDKKCDKEYYIEEIERTVNRLKN